MPDAHDAIIIGAGHNGLTCACYLARAGLRALVVEQHHQIGGMTRSEEMTLPGFIHDVHASGFQLGNLSPSVEELALEERGFERLAPPVNYAHVFPGGRSIRFCRDLDGTCKSIAQFSEKDAAAWRGFMDDYYANKSGIVQALFRPPEPAPIGAEQQTTLSAWADATFESEEVKATMAAWGAHVCYAPNDKGGVAASLFGSIIQDGGNRPIKGGMQKLPDALASYLREHGGEIRTNAEVERILVEQDRAVGVRLTDGTLLRADRAIASNANPLRVALDFLTEDEIGSDVAAKMRSLKPGLGQMTIWLALDGQVDFASGVRADETLYVHATEPRLDFFEKLIREARAGLLPETPMLLFVNEGAVDPSRVPEGRSTLRILVMLLPYQIADDATGVVSGRTWQEAAETYADHAIDLAERLYAPGLKRRILKRTVHDPWTMSKESPDAIRGDIGHIGVVPEQSGALRPIAEMGQYRTPVGNLYLCGSGSHPGGGVSLACGRNAALRICDDLGVRF